MKNLEANKKTSVRPKKKRRGGGRKYKGQERREIIRENREREKKRKKEGKDQIKYQLASAATSFRKSVTISSCISHAFIKSHFRQLLHEVYGSVSNNTGKVEKHGQRNAPVPHGCQLRLLIINTLYLLPGCRDTPDACTAFLALQGPWEQTFSEALTRFVFQLLLKS